jgi:hypothetical protein
MSSQNLLNCVFVVVAAAAVVLCLSVENSFSSFSFSTSTEFWVLYVNNIYQDFINIIEIIYSNFQSF